MNSFTYEIDEHIKSREEKLSELNHEYRTLLESRPYTSNSEIGALNSDLYKLMSEVKVLRESEPEIMPKCYAFLYAWVQHSLNEDIKEKENIIFNLDKMLQQSSKKKELMLEDAKSKNELLNCLHRKMVRRLRRLSRRFSTSPLSKQSEKVSKSTRDIAGKVLLRSFYRVLKEFVIELQDRTFESDNWDQSQPVFIDETYCTEHIKLLCNINIIQKSTKSPPSYYLRTKNEIAVQ